MKNKSLSEQLELIQDELRGLGFTITQSGIYIKRYQSEGKEIIVEPILTDVNTTLIEPGENPLIKIEGFKIVEIQMVSVNIEKDLLKKTTPTVCHDNIFELTEKINITSIKLPQMNIAARWCVKCPKSSPPINTYWVINGETLCEKCTWPMLKQKTI